MVAPFVTRIAWQTSHPSEGLLHLLQPSWGKPFEEGGSDRGSARQRLQKSRVSLRPWLFTLALHAGSSRSRISSLFDDDGRVCWWLAVAHANFQNHVEEHEFLGAHALVSCA